MQLFEQTGRQLVKPGAIGAQAREIDAVGGIFVAVQAIAISECGSGRHALDPNPPSKNP
jgi:hypothetical protein